MPLATPRAALPTSSASSRRSQVLGAARSLVVELVLVSVGLSLYRAGRLITKDSSETAARNAQMIIDLEMSLGMFTERSVQHAALQIHGAIELLNRYYVYVHFPATVTFLVFVFVRRHSSYSTIRNWFGAVTLSGLVIHVLFPLAPPRLAGGFVDTLRVYGPTVYDPDTARSMANQFAAMPSLHFGWALIVGLGMCILSNHRCAWLWLLHPVMTLLAIVATGNHYWADAAVAGVLVAVAGSAIGVWQRADRRTLVNPSMAMVPAAAGSPDRTSISRTAPDRSPRSTC